MIRNKYKKLFKFALYLPIVSSIGIFPIVSSIQTNNFSYSKIKSKNLNSNSISVNNINSFADYDAIVNNTTFQSISTKIGFLGKTKDNKTAILTSYGGAIVWTNTIANNQIVKDFYSSKNINDLSDYVINGWTSTTISNNEYISILFGTVNLENQIVLFLNASTGEIFTPYTTSNDNVANSYVGNIAYVGNGLTTLYKTSTSKVLALGGSTSLEVSQSLCLITISNKYVSSSKPMIDSIGLNETDKFVGFTSGYLSVNSNVDFFQFMKTTDNMIYTVAVSSLTLEPIINNNNKATVDLSVFTATNNFTEANIPKYGFFHTASGSNNNTPKFVYLVPGQTTKLHNVTYNVSQKTFTKTELDISTIKPNDVITNLIFDYTNNKLHFSLSSSNDAIITYVNVANSTMQYETLKTKGNLTLTKPWLMTPVIGSGSNAAFIAINDQNTVIKNYTKSDNTIAPETNLTFSKYNNPLTSIKNDSTIKQTMPQSIQTSALVKHLNFTSSGYTVTAQIINSNNELGTLSFKYVVRYKAWWNENSTQSFEIPIFVDGLYRLSNVQVSFVLSENVDPNKYNAIEKLKESKPANAITKQDVLDNFIVYNILDKNGNQFVINQNHITLQSLEDDYSLKVTLNLPSSSFPSGYNLLSYSAIFKGFSKLDGYNVTIKDNNSSEIAPFKSKFASEVTFDNVVSSFVDFKTAGYSYYTSIDDWDYQYKYDDYLGTFTITKLYYKRTQNVPSSLPLSKREIIGLNNQKTYTGFKNLLSSFTTKPTFKDITTDIAGSMNPVDAWKEWNQAINSGINNEIVSTLLYNSVVFDLVKSPTDLIFTPLNLDIANQEKKLKFEIRIKENASLNIKYKGNDLVFTKEVENNLINKNTDKNYYPFKAEWNIDSLSEYFEWNIPQGSGFKHSIENGVERLTIDLDQQSWQLINRQMTVDDFLANPEQYKTAIVQLFNYSDNYTIQFSDPISNYEEGIITIRVDFIEKNNSNNTTTFNSSTKQNNSSINTTKEIIIKGFKIPTSQFAIIVPLLISVIISLAVIMSIVYIFLRTKKVKNKKIQNFESKKLIETQKEKYVIIEQEIDNKKTETKKNPNNKKLTVNRLKGINSKYKRR